MEWHNYLGPHFFMDKNCTREITKWYKDQLICRALDWFLNRGKIA